MGGSGIPPDALALIDPTLHPATSPSAVSAANQAPASETASPNLTTDLHAPPVPLVNTTALMDIPPFTSLTANGQPFIFPSMISFAPQDSIGTALHIPLPLVPVVSSPIPASPLLPVPPQGPFNTTPTPPVPPSVEPASVTSLLIRPAPKEKKRPAVPKKKPGKKPSVKATSTKAPNVEASTTVPTLTVESIGRPNKDQQAEVPVGLQTGRGQRIRKVTVSKEVVPLTDNQHRNAKEGERAPKRRRNH